MAFAKGRSECKAERDLVVQGFIEQLHILEDVQNEQESDCKSRLKGIITDPSIDYDEGNSLRVHLDDYLQELVDLNIRIRRSIFIGLYSFWEVSLMNIAYTFYPYVNEYIKNRSSKKPYRLCIYDYLRMVYKDVIPAEATMINHSIRELRNYMVHGSLDDERKNRINDLISSHPEFHIVNCGGTDYFINSYKGLEAFVKLFADELDNAENAILSNNNELIL